MLGWRVDRAKRKDSSSDTFKESFHIQPKSVIKESLQNSQDVPVKITKEELLNKTFFDYSEEETINVTYQILEIKGKAKIDYLEALDVDSFKIYLKSLIKTLENSHKKEEKEAEIKKLKKSLKLMDKNNTDPIFLLNTVDKNTLGLIGKKNATIPPLNFKNFNLSVADSEKEHGGGSWAVGKIAFTTCSDINTLINCSNLSVPIIKNGVEKNLRRTYGLSIQLPFDLDEKFLDEDNKVKSELREDEEDQDYTYFDNTWLFGEVTKEISATELLPGKSTVEDFFDENREVTSKMLIDVLEDSETGTVVQVPFFNMEYKESARKNSRVAKNLEEIANEFAETCSKLAWESLDSKKTNIHVQYGTISKGTVRDAKLKTIVINNELSHLNDGTIENFIQLSNGMKNAIKNNQLDDGIEIATEDKTNYYLNDVEILIDSENSNKKFTHKPYLALSIFNKDEDHKIPKEYQNKIAIMRSPGLVIEYRELNQGNSQKVIFGILYLGSSLLASEDNKKAEQFYRLSEDKAHNTIFTESQSNLLSKGYYKNPQKKIPRSDLIKQTWFPIEERVNSLLVVEDETKGKRYFELERMLKLTADPEKVEDYLLEPTAKSNSKNKILQPVIIPGKTKLKIVNKSAKPTSLSGENLGSGVVQISEIKVDDEYLEYLVELSGRDIIVQNKTEEEIEFTYEVSFKKTTDLGNRYVGLNPNVKAEKV